MNTFKNGLVLSGKTIGFISLILLFGIAITLMGNFYIGIPLVIIWGLLVFRKKGVTVDFEKETIKPFVSLMGFKIGKTRPASEFPFHKIKKINKTQSYATRGTEGSYSTSATGIVIYDKRNKREIILTKKESREELEKTSTQLNQIGVIKKQQLR
jgi:hypothetical protein